MQVKKKEVRKTHTHQESKLRNMNTPTKPDKHNETDQN